MFKETKKFRKRPNFTRLHILLLFIAIGFVAVDIAAAGQGKSAIAQRRAKRNSNTSQSFAAPTVASAVNKSDPIRRRRPGKTNQKQSRSFRRKFSEVEIVLSDDFTLADASSLPAAPGSNLTVLNDPMRVGIQLPISEIKTLVKEGIEVTTLRNFVLVEGSTDKTNAMANKATTAASSSSAYIEGYNNRTVDIPINGSWIGSDIILSGAPGGETVTSVDVYYGVESSWGGYVEAELSDGNPYFAYNLLYEENGYYSETVTGIAKFNGRAVNQQWVLWARDRYYRYELGYIESWWIKVYYGPPLSEIHGFKFDDVDGNSVWDPNSGEPWLLDWEIYLDLNDNGQFDTGEPKTITTTDPNGHYSFYGLESGTYKVREVPKAGWTQTLPGGDGAYTLILDPESTGKSVFQNINFGNTTATPTVTISGYVRTSGGAAILGVLMSTGTGESDTTDASGYYELTFSSNPWTGTITPSKDFWAFNPPPRSYLNLTSGISNEDYTATPANLISIKVNEDVFADSANPDANYGSVNYLVAGSNGSSDFRAFLKFDLSGIPLGNVVTSATLRLHNSFISNPAPDLEVYRVYDRWEESTVTWNDQPGNVSTPGIVTLPNTGSINGSITTWDVTEDVDSEYIGDGIYSIKIMIYDESQIKFANFPSMDSGNPSLTPELVIEFDPIFGGGSGEVDSPYQIWTDEQFNTIGLHPNRWTKNYELMADISMAGYTSNSYNLIGTSVASSTSDGEFKGVFDGKYHSIKDFSTNESVFGYIKGATIRALKLISPDISSGSYTGAIAGHIEGGNILDCQVQGGTVDGSNYVGGLVGYCSGANIINCSSSASVSGYDYVGGFIGGPGSFGGVGSVSNCYATGSVQGSHYVGGFMGSSSDSPITNCYSAGLVTGTTNVGAFSGYNSNQYTLESTIYNCFYDSDVNQTLPAIGNVTGPFGVTDESTANMQTQATFTNAGWDFVGETANGGSDNWTMLPAGYPALWYELPSPPDLPPFAGGAGTAGDPYLIETEIQLNSIGHNSRLMDKHFKLINDLDMDGMKYYMIAPEPYEFSGTFDGNGHTVSNILIEPLFDSSSFGFIAILKGSEASINDLTLVDPVINSDWGWRVGSLVGENEGGTITNCHAVNADVRAMASVGGLVGVNYQYSRISGCSATGKVSDDTIMSGFSIVGGLVGENTYWSEIENSFAICSVNGEKSVGGLVGLNVIYSLITNCYAGGDVIGTNNDIGGLVGRMGGSSEIAYCYSSSVVTGPDETESVGGLVGGKISSADNYYTACFWDSEINPGLTGIGTMVDPDGMTGESTANMQTETTFTDAGWDFTTPVWKILEGIDYPKLNWDNSISTTFSLDHTWMYQNLPEGKTGSNLTAAVAIIDDPSSNNSYSYQWEIILPSDVTIEPSTVSGGDSGDESWTFAAPSCNEPTGISDSGQMFTVKVTVTGDDFGNVGSAEMEFAIALLGDINNDRVVSGADRGITNVFWRNGSVGPFTLRDCDLNCDGVVNGADRGITNTIWRGLLGSNSVTVPCPVR